MLWEVAVSNYVVCADVHIGNHRRWGGVVRVGMNERCRLALWTLQEAVAYTRSRQATLLVAGDLFDDDHPLPQIISRVNEALHPLQKEGRVVCIRGNHDMRTDAARDNALSAIQAAVFEDPVHIGLHGVRGGLMIPFKSGPAIDYISSTLANASSTSTNHKFLVVHAGIRDENTPWYLQTAEDSVDVHELAKLAKTYGYDTVFAGNWHHHQRWQIDGVDIIQVGSLCPTGLDDTSPLHGVWDDQKKALVQISGPRFVKAKTYADFLKAIDTQSTYASQLYCVLETSTEAEVRAAETQYALLPEAVRQRTTLDIALSSDAAYTAARAAAEAATDANTRDDAVAEYVAKMPLPDGVDRDRVLALTKGFLK